MFHKTALRLAGLYLAVLMTISFFFSIVVYELSVQELERGLRIPDSLLSQLPEDQLLPSTLQQLRELREQRYLEAKDRVVSRLLLTNLFILVGGGLLSYYLALRTLKPIERAHASLERFTADASHELRTPIAAMQSETEVALMNPKLTLGDAKRQLSSNLEELARLTELSEGLLKLARLENNDVPWQPLVVHTLVDKALRHVRPLAKKKHIDIEVEAKDQVTVSGERASLTEAVIIVLENAIKYSPEKTQVKVFIRKSQRGVDISIKDQGIGIKDQELPYIFDRFYRSDTARTRQNAQGYGIGLAIAKNIIGHHGGRITVSSKPDKGSTFVIHLPSRG